MIGLRKGIVVAVHPEDYSVDLVMSDDGSRLVGVQVLSPNGSARSGTVDLPFVPERPEKWDIRQRDGQDMQAMVGYFGRNPVVMGFLYPQVNQMTLTDGKTMRYRHSSDVGFSIDGDGNVQLSHPSGTYVRIGENPDLDDVGAKSVDGSQTDRNTGKKVSIRVGLAGGKAVLTINPDGDVSLITKGSIDMDAQGAIGVSSPVGITLNTPMVRVPNGDVVARSISLLNHVHGGVEPGGGTSGRPK